MMPRRFKYAWTFAVMPLQWMRADCYDREAHVVAWKHALAWALLGRGWRFNAQKRKPAKEQEASRG